MSTPAPPPPRLTSLSHGGGCGCKIAPGVLTELLRRSAPAPALAQLLVGTETADDAAVYQLNDTQAIIATTDFFMPIVDDPYDFGRIAAANALSDVYAMGGTPLLALAIVGMPVNVLPAEVIRDILRGGESICAQAGIAVAGGHSIDSAEPIYGLAAIGMVHPQHVKRNCDARAGDALVLGKPLGVGILSAALKRQQLELADYRAMVELTTQLNRAGAALAEIAGVHAMTDVTGFGLARASARHVSCGSRRGAPEHGQHSAARQRARARCSGRCHRGLRAQLVVLRFRGAPGAGDHACAAGAALRPADLRRTAGGLRPSGAAAGDGRLCKARRRAGRAHRHHGGG